MSGSSVHKLIIFIHLKILALALKHREWANTFTLIWKVSVSECNGLVLTILVLLIENSLDSFKGFRMDEKCLQKHCLFNGFFCFLVSKCANTAFVVFISSQKRKKIMFLNFFTNSLFQQQTFHPKKKFWWRFCNSNSSLTEVLRWLLNWLFFLAKLGMQDV